MNKKYSSQITSNGTTYNIFSLKKFSDQSGTKIDELPYSLKILLENLLRNLDGNKVTETHLLDFVEWLKTGSSKSEISYHPSRVLLQDFTGVPAVVDLAAMRDAIVELGGDAKKINPITPVDLVIDHSVSVDFFGSQDSYEKNKKLEFERNEERYKLLKWAQKAFDNFRVVPPGTGICHQVNLEYLATTVTAETIGGENWAYPDTCVGTDSHTTMINGIGVLGWGVGGIEAEAAMLKQPISMQIPEVVGFKMEGALSEGVTATDLVLAVVEMLRQKGVVGKFVEFFGSGLNNLSLADRATISNMAPEYGATCGIFPIDAETVKYLKFTGRTLEHAALVETYAKEQGLWRDDSKAAKYTTTLELDISVIRPSIAGPKRPQDKIELGSAHSKFHESLKKEFHKEQPTKSASVEGQDYTLNDGSVVLAAITSCTNTSNPTVMIAAGLVAQKARKLGLHTKPWVKTSLAPGSKVVTDYLVAANLQTDLNELGFNLVGYGCTSCIGNSGPLAKEISKSIKDNDLVVCGVLSGNRNFEGRISPDTKANYLASPPLVVLYALAGTMNIDLVTDSIAKTKDGKDVFLKDLWPSNEEIKQTVEKFLTPEMFTKRYANVFEGPKEWRDLPSSTGIKYDWDDTSTYIKKPDFFAGMKTSFDKIGNIKNARVLALLGDSITTDHISPAGAIGGSTPAGVYLKEHGIEVKDFNSYGSRRGNHEVMTRGTFANIRIKNKMASGKEGGFTLDLTKNQVSTIFEASQNYKSENIPLVVIAGKEYGTGSSRDWAAKGTLLLGIKAVIAESFERIHRSNLLGMGVLPLEFINKESASTLLLDGSELISIEGLENLKPSAELVLKIDKDGVVTKTKVKCRIDTSDEMEYFDNGGILQYAIRQLL